MKSFPSWQLRKLIGDLPAAVIPAGFLKFPYLSSCLYPPPFPGPLASNILYILSDFCHLGWFPLVASQRLPHLHVLQGFCAQPVTLLLISVSLNPVNFIITISWIWLCFFFFFLISMFVLIISTLRVQKSPISLICYSLQSYAPQNCWR